MSIFYILNSQKFTFLFNILIDLTLFDIKNFRMKKFILAAGAIGLGALGLYLYGYSGGIEDKENNLINE